MTTFVVTYTHPDERGWQAHLDAHLRWLIAESEAGRLRLSGPSVGTEVRSAMLVIEVADRASLDAMIATDPFWVEGLVADLTVAEWDPMFGDLARQYVGDGVEPTAVDGRPGIQ